MRTKLILAALLGLGTLAAGGALPPRQASADDAAIRVFGQGMARVPDLRAPEGTLVAVGDIVLGSGPQGDATGMAAGTGRFVTAIVADGTRPAFLAASPDRAEPHSCPATEDGWGARTAC